MVIVSIAFALVGLFVYLCFFIIGIKAGNRTAERIMIIAGFIIGLVSINVVSSLLDVSYAVSGKASSYFIIIMILIAIRSHFIKKRGREINMTLLVITTVLIAILVTGFFGFIWHVKNENKIYTYMQSKLPNDLTSVIIQELPMNLCDKAMEQNASKMLNKCPDCIIEVNKCIPELHEDYDGIFENKTLGFPYYSIESKYPERFIIFGFSDEEFQAYCEQLTQKDQSVTCIQ